MKLSIVNCVLLALSGLSIVHKTVAMQYVRTVLMEEGVLNVQKMIKQRVKWLRRVRSFTTRYVSVNQGTGEKKVSEIAKKCHRIVRKEACTVDFVIRKQQIELQQGFTHWSALSQINVAFTSRQRGLKIGITSEDVAQRLCKTTGSETPYTSYSVI
ncbi:hypothetical protein MAR_007640 [Mya arenaria]|uniref:Uncharacterized protein n=1 Tax=Mya arenaria TaxID=6604 RepID=A0ABY7DW54_MYAAR|nr:hypothetical protein MAR_007640 [Mya arenaria]